MNSPSSRVLVMGATGMLGRMAVEVLAHGFDVVGSVRDVDAARRYGLPAQRMAERGLRPAGSCLTRPIAFRTASGFTCSSR